MVSTINQISQLDEYIAAQPYIYIQNREIKFKDLLNEKHISKSKHEAELRDFLLTWFNVETTFSQSTSGSTGLPKLISIDKKLAILSALKTLNFFEIAEKSTFLNLLSPKFIGGKMLIIRAILSKSKIVSYPAEKINWNDVAKEQYSFCSMVPIQLENLIDSKTSLKVQYILLGGASISNQQQAKIKSTNLNVFQSFGMTETISHIALRKLNPNTETLYTVLNNVKIDIDHRSCLCINADVTNNKNIITNDVVKIIDKNKFQWLGRYDNVINSGGIKILIEELEDKYKEVFKKENIEISFYLSKSTDDKFGETIKINFDIKHNRLISNALNILNKHFPSHQLPKTHQVHDNFEYTESGKLKRI